MKSKLIHVLGEIGNLVIEDKTVFQQDFLLPSGKIGASLFLCYSGRYLRNNKFLEYSYVYFEESFNALSSFGEKIKGKSLYGGYTGALWLYQHYINIGFIEFSQSSKDIFNVFDELILKEFDAEKQTKNYDLLYGLLGYGVYFLERNKFISQKDKLDHLINILEEIALEKECGITWEDRFERKENKDRECSKTCVIFINHCFLLRKA
jgi:lantibiotic biosynthesis protein